MEKSSLTYKSGDAFLPSRTVKFLYQYIIGNDTSLYYINLWHGMHFLSGVLFSLFHLFVYSFQHPFVVYITIHSLWEIWQVYIGMTVPNLRGFIDILNDTFFGELGSYLTIHFLERK